MSEDQSSSLPVSYEGPSSDESDPDYWENHLSQWRQSGLNRKRSMKYTPIPIAPDQIFLWLYFQFLPILFLGFGNGFLCKVYWQQFLVIIFINCLGESVE